MATPVLTGTPVSLTLASADATPTPEDFTIPSDCIAVGVALQWYPSTKHLVDVSLEAVQPNQEFEYGADISNDCNSYGAVWFNPTTGANQTLSIEWDAAPNVNDGPCGCIFFVKDCDTAALRDLDADGETSSTPCTVTVDSETTDIIWKFDAKADGEVVPGLTSGYTSDLTGNQNGSYFRLSHVAGSATSTVVDSEDENYSAVVAFVFKESSGSIIPQIMHHRRKLLG